MNPLLGKRQTAGSHKALLGVQQQQREAMLAPHLAAGARARKGRTSQIDGHLVGLGPGGDVLAPQRFLVAPGCRPRPRIGSRSGSRGGGTVGGKQQHLFGRGADGHLGQRYSGGARGFFADHRTDMTGPPTEPT